MIRSRALIGLAVGFLALALPLMVHAVLLVPVNLEYMTSQADRIFYGKVITIKDDYDSDGHWVQFITFKVIESYKGDVGDELTIKQLNPTPPTDSRETGDSIVVTSFAGSLPQYHIGDEVLVFLSPDSDIGFTTSVGLLQGTFQVSGGDTKTLINGIQNAGLLNGMSTSTSSSQGLSAVRFKSLQNKPSDLTFDHMKLLLQGLLSESGEAPAAP